jgi:hypothetical protein
MIAMKMKSKSSDGCEKFPLPPLIDDVSWARARAADYSLVIPLKLSCFYVFMVSVCLCNLGAFPFRDVLSKF